MTITSTPLFRPLSPDKMDLSGLYPWIQSVGKDTLSTYNLEMTRGAEMGETMGFGSEVQSSCTKCLHIRDREIILQTTTENNRTCEKNAGYEHVVKEASIIVSAPHSQSHYIDCYEKCNYNIMSSDVSYDNVNALHGTAHSNQVLACLNFAGNASTEGQRSGTIGEMLAVGDNKGLVRNATFGEMSEGHLGRNERCRDARREVNRGRGLGKCQLVNSVLPGQWCVRWHLSVTFMAWLCVWWGVLVLGCRGTQAATLGTAELQQATLAGNIHNNNNVARNNILDKFNSETNSDDVILVNNNIQDSKRLIASVSDSKLEDTKKLIGKVSGIVYNSNSLLSSSRNSHHTKSSNLLQTNNADSDHVPNNSEDDNAESRSLSNKNGNQHEFKQNAAPYVEGTRLKRQTSQADSNDYSPVDFDGNEYLQNFGFLPQSDAETGALRTKEELERSLQAFQRFAGLRPTGTFDEETKQKMVAPRCGVRDVFDEESEPDRRRRHHHPGSRSGHEGHHRSKRYTIGPQHAKWQHGNVTYRILNYTPDLDQSQISDSINRAFIVWSRVTQLDFSEVFHGHADIIIKFARGYHADGYPFDGPGLILAHAFFPGEDRGGDMHFDEDETWTYRSYEGTDLFSVAAHEIGHSLGLAHSSVLGSLMYPWYQGYTPNFQLSSDDIAGIQYLYGVRQTPYYPERPHLPATVRPEHEPPVPPTEPPYIPPVERPPHGPTGDDCPATDVDCPDHRPETPPTPTVPPPADPNAPPDPCVSGIDAVSMFRGETFLFKGKWFWRLDENGLMEGYPVEISRFWYDLPEDHPGFDAAYERTNDGKMVFFKNDRYWVYDGNRLDHGVPQEGRPITDLGFPSDIKKVDAAFVWGYNGKTYFISGDMYWKYYEGTGHMAHNYPRDISLWKGVPVPVSGAFRHRDTKTYFFHGQHYYEFHDLRMKVRKKPRSIAQDWLGCTAGPSGPELEGFPGSSGGHRGESGGVRVGAWGAGWVVTVCVMCMLLIR